MGFLWFGDNSKKIIEANENSKKNLISALASATTMCTNPQVCAAFNDIKNELQGQGQSDSKETTAIDVQLKQLINEVNVCIAKNQFSSAVTKINRAKMLVADRRGLCKLGGQKTKADIKADKKAEKEQRKILGKKGQEVTQSRLDQLIDMQTHTQDELNDLQRQYEDLQKRHLKNPNDRSIITQASVVLNKAKSKQQALNQLNAEIARETETTEMHANVDLAKDLTSGRTYTDDQVQADIESANEANIQMAESMDTVNQIRNARNAGLGSYEDPFSQADPFAVQNDPFAQADPFAANNGNANTAATQAAPAQTQFGNFDASTMGSREMGVEIHKAITELENGIDQYNDKLEDVSEDLKELDNDIIPLLRRRETASASECLTLDGQIDQIQAKRNTVQIKIKRYRNAISKLTEEKSLLEQLDLQQDLTQTNSRINEITGGKFSDMVGLAQFIDSEIQRSNDELDTVGAAGVAANQTEISMNTYSGGMAQNGNLVKDEHRYDDLKNEFGKKLQMN